MQEQGTTSSSTEVSRMVEVSEAVVLAADTTLIANAISAAKKAEGSAVAFTNDVVALANAVEALHNAGTWSRQVDESTGELFTSAKAYYSHLFQSKAFPRIHTTLRRELVEALVDPDSLELIVGSNELAALTGVDKGTMSRDVGDAKGKAGAAKAEADAEADAEAREEMLDACAADFTAQALAEGRSEADATHYGEEARATLKRQLEGKADAEAEAKAKADADAKEKADADADVKATNKALAAFTNAATALLQRDYKLTAAQRATAVEAALKVRDKINELEALIAKAMADAEAKAKGDAEAKAKADADAKAEADRAALVKAEADAGADAGADAPTGPTPKPGPTPRRGKRTA